MKIVAALFFTLLLMVAPVGATTIGFDDNGSPVIADGWGPDAITPFNGQNPKGTIITNQYASLGVLFSTQNASGTTTSDWVSSGQGITPGSGVSGNFLAVMTWPQTGTGGTLTIEFVGGTILAGGVTPLSFYLNDTEHFKSVSTYGISGNLLETQTLSGPGVVDKTFNTWTVDGIHKIVISDSDANGFELDTLTFGEITAIPEPGTLALLGAGLVALGLISRRRRSR